MLVIQRRVHQRVIIDFTRATDADIEALRSGKAQIVVEPLMTRMDGSFGRRTRLGFEAPNSVKVDREEVWVERRANPVQYHQGCGGMVVDDLSEGKLPVRRCLGCGAIFNPRLKAQAPLTYGPARALTAAENERVVGLLEGAAFEREEGSIHPDPHAARSGTANGERL